MPPETTIDGFRPVDLSNLALFVIKRLGESDRLMLTETETEEGINILLIVEADDDKN
jgi:hypothetical protein